MNHPMDASTERNDDAAAAASTVEPDATAVTTAATTATDDTASTTATTTAATTTTTGSSTACTGVMTEAESFKSPTIPPKKLPELSDAATDSAITGIAATTGSVVSTVTTTTTESLKAPPDSSKKIQDSAAAAAAFDAAFDAAFATSTGTTTKVSRKVRHAPTGKMSATEVFKMITIPPKEIPLPVEPLPPTLPKQTPLLQTLDASTIGTTNEASTVATTATDSLTVTTDLPLPSELNAPLSQPPFATPHLPHPPYHHPYCYPPPYYYGYHHYHPPPHYSVHPSHHQLHHVPPPYPQPPSTSHDSTMDAHTARATHNEATPEGPSLMTNQNPSSWMDPTNLPHVHNHFPHYDTNPDTVTNSSSSVVNDAASPSPTVTNLAVRTTGVSSGVASTYSSMNPTTLTTHLGPRLPVPKQQTTRPTQKQRPPKLNDSMTARTPIRSNTTPKATTTGRDMYKLSRHENSAPPKKKTGPVMCQVPKPVVMVDQLTYDWSSLKLNGTLSWNHLLQSSSRESTTERPPPEVTALHTYQLMKHLQESLFVDSIIDPPPDSALHYHLHLPNSNNDNNKIIETGLDNNGDETMAQSKESSPLLSPITDNVPDEMRPLYANAATFYRKLTEERKKFHQEQPSQRPDGSTLLQPPLQPLPHTLKDRYRLLTATELRQYVQQTKREIASLNRYEQRVVQTAKRLLLHPSNGSMNKYDKDQNASHTQSSSLINRDDEIRRRYHQHIRKKRSSQPSPQNESSNTTTTRRTIPPLLWQDDDISTLLFKKHKS